MQRFPLPAEASYSYSQGFTHLHSGVDIMAPLGTSVLAVERGRAWSSVEPKGGNVVYLEAVDGARYFYGHLSGWSPKLAGVTSAAPVQVEAGDALGFVGTTGNAVGRPPHLHFQKRSQGMFGGQVTDPFPDLLSVDPKRAGEPLDIYAGYKRPVREALVLAFVFWLLHKGDPMTLVLTVPNGQPNQLVDLITESQTPVRALAVETDLSACTAVAGLTVAAMNAALATGAPEVCFPAGVYVVNGPVTSNTAGQVLRFAPGAVLQMAANGLGSLTLNGDSSSIVGKPVVRFDTISAVAYVAVDLHGIAAKCEQIRFELNANVANCVLLRLSGLFSAVGPVSFAGTGGSFKYGLELSKQDGTAVLFARFGSLLWLMTDDGVNTRTFSALVRYRSTRSEGGPISIQNGARHFFNAIVEIDGQHNSLRDPQIDSSAGSNYGVLQKDDAEFFAIYGGEIVGNYLANSVGIACGDGSKPSGAPAVGQLKLFDTKIRNWDFGIRITGSCDTPGLDSATIANNKTAQVQIDSQRGADVWPVSGLTVLNVYSEQVAFPAAPFLHCKTGTLLGMAVVGCEIGYSGTAFLVDAAFGIATGEFLGCRFPGTAPTDAVTTPNTLTQFYFGRNSQSGTNLIGKGAFAANAMSAFDPILTGLTVGAVNPGSLTNRMVSVFTDIYTANFGDLAPGAVFPIDFSFPGVPTPTTAMLNVTMGSALGAKAFQGIQFQWWIDVAGHIGGVAYNPTLAPINAVSGGVRFTITVFG